MDEKPKNPAPCPIIEVDRVKPPHGRLTIYVTDKRTGETKEAFKSKNLILTAFRRQSQYIIGSTGVDWPNYRVSLMGIGTSAATPTSLLVAALTGAVTTSVTYTYLPVTRPYNRMTFTGVFTYGLGNGVSYQEAGLITGDGTLITRVVFGAMTKSAMFQWTLVWPIEWS